MTFTYVLKNVNGDTDIGFNATSEATAFAAMCVLCGDDRGQPSLFSSPLDNKPRWSLETAEGAVLGHSTISADDASVAGHVNDNAVAVADALLSMIVTRGWSRLHDPFYKERAKARDTARDLYARTLAPCQIVAVGMPVQLLVHFDESAAIKMARFSYVGEYSVQLTSARADEEWPEHVYVRISTKTQRKDGTLRDTYDQRLVGSRWRDGWHNTTYIIRVAEGALAGRVEGDTPYVESRRVTTGLPRTYASRQYEHLLYDEQGRAYSRDSARVRVYSGDVDPRPRSFVRSSDLAWLAAGWDVYRGEAERMDSAERDHRNEGKR